MIDEETEIEIVSAGEQLKAYREEKNISIIEIATQMRLDSRIIRAIEENDYAALPDPIYVRGYIRSYCKLLGKNPDEFLDSYRKNVQREDPEIIPEIKYPAQTSSSDKPVKAFTYLISLGLVLLVIAWWQSNFIVKIPTNLAKSPVREDLPVTPDKPVFEEITIDEINRLSNIPMESPEDISIAPDDDTSESNISGSIAPMPGENAATVRANELDQVPGSSSTGNSDQSRSAPPVGPDNLGLKLTADSWIEIFDINGQKIYFGLARTGDEMTLNGTAPFEILLGFAQGVSMEFNGKPVDQSPFTRAGVARFTLTK